MSAACPQDVFNQILFDATFRNALTEGGIDGGGIDYQLCGPNCNTWTKYIGITYLGFDVFNYLPKNDQLFNYTGKNQTFADCADEKDARNCAILENISQKFFNKYSDDFNFDNLKIELYNVTSATDQTTITGFSARISDGIHNFLFDSDNAVGNYIEDVGDNNSYIVAGRGDNDTIIAGNGNDIVDAGSGTGEKTASKNLPIWAAATIYMSAAPRMTTSFLLPATIPSYWAPVPTLTPAVTATIWSMPAQSTIPPPVPPLPKPVF